MWRSCEGKVYRLISIRREKVASFPVRMLGGVVENRAGDAGRQGQEKKREKRFVTDDVCQTNKEKELAAR